MWVLKKIPTRESAFGSLETLIEQGLEEDAVLEGQRDVKVDAIVEEVGEVLGVQPKFSLIGEQGASVLAEMGKAGVKMYADYIDALDNLAIARQMEERGDSTLNIRIATGWERGADGKWRYEVEDVFPEDMEERIKDAIKQGEKGVDLTEIIGYKHPALVYSSPFKYKVVAYNDPDSTSWGYTSTDKKTIGINIAAPENKWREIFAHELQHIIQMEEGFSIGTGAYSSEGALPVARRYFENLELGASYYWRKNKEGETIIYRDEIVEAIKKGEYLLSYNSYTKKFVNWLEEQDAEILLTTFTEALREYKQAALGEAYHRAGGEVEARNVQKRLGFTTEQRRNTLLSETADVAPEDQIHIFGIKGAEMAMAKNVGLPKEEYAKLASTIMTRQHTYGRPPFDYAFTDGSFYVYDYLGDGDSIINFVMPIVGNEDLIQNITNSIDNGTITDTRGLDLYAENLQGKQRVNYRRFADAFKKRHGNRGYGVTFRGDSASNGGTYFEDSKRIGGDATTRGTSGNIDESANQELTTRFSLITPEMDASYLDAVERGDMETAQRMVMEAAKLAMPNTKVVDEDGNPKVVYHGTPNEFTVFGEDISSKHPWTYEGTYYFTDNEANAKTYGGRSVGAFLNITNPYEYDFEGRAWKNLEIGIAVLYARDFSILASGFKTKEEAEAWRENYIKENPDSPLVKDADHIIVDETAILGQAGPTTDEQTQIAKEGGYDGNIQYNIVDVGDTEMYEEDGVFRERVDEEALKPRTNYIAFEPSQIKSADPVTYDDNGNVIPLSERFNPKNKDIRYSLPTDLLTDFADEFKVLQDEYASLDPAIIDHKHPFRAHKREVVQKYADHVADVLGLSCETFVIDAENDAQVAEAYDRYKKSHQLVSQQYPHRATPLADLNDFKAGLKGDNGKYASGLYYNGTDFILMIISENDGYNEQNGYLQVNIHENVHGAMEALGITDFEKEMVLSEAEKYQPNALKKYLDGYDNETDATKGEEIVAYAINSRLKPTHGKLLLEFFEGDTTLSDIWKSYNLQLPLRLSLTRKILNYLKDGYEAKNKITNNAGGSNKAAAGNSPNATNSKRLSSEYLGEDFRVAERWDRSVDTRYSLPDPDPM